MPKRVNDSGVEVLSEKQRIFCREYILDWNATRAAKSAGYSEDTAYAIGAENLRKPKIQAYIAEIQKDLEKVAGISRLRIINEHLNIVNTSIAHLHNTWITRKEFENLTDGQKSAIAELSYQTRIEKDYSTNPDGDIVQVDYVKIKLYDRQKSMDSLSKMLGYNEAEKVQHSGEIKGFTIAAASGKRTV
jgi:phage terminase small subunit